MKQRNLFITLAMVIVATAVAFVSCKKETGNTLAPKAANTQRTVDISKIEDMNVYLHDFRQKMTESKSGEAMNTEDAAWHLACLANYDFCRVNVEYNDFKFDTIEMQVNVTDGMVLMGDLNAAYEQMCAAIQQFKKGFSHYNENLYFINMFIDANGNAKIALMTSLSETAKGLDDHLWYFPNSFDFDMDSVCDYYFIGLYKWDDRAVSELQRILNLFENHTSLPDISCYTPTRSNTFEYPNWWDPYGSPFNNSRLYSGIYASYNLYDAEMCYCLDSYLGLGYDFIDNTYEDEHPVSWTVQAMDSVFPNHKLRTYYHSLTVQYGQLNSITPHPDPD